MIQRIHVSTHARKHTRNLSMQLKTHIHANQEHVRDFHVCACDITQAHTNTRTHTHLRTRARMRQHACARTSTHKTIQTSRNTTEQTNVLTNNETHTYALRLAVATSSTAYECILLLFSCIKESGNGTSQSATHVKLNKLQKEPHFRLPRMRRGGHAAEHYQRLPEDQLRTLRC